MVSDRVSDGALRELSQSSLNDMRIWMRLNQPESNDDRTFWWANLTYRALFNMNRTQSEVERSQFATLAYGALLEEVDQGVINRVQGAVRVAELAADYFSHGGCDAEVISVDAAVARNLDLIAVPLGIVIERSRDWQTLPREKIRELADAKDLIRSCTALASRIEDPVLAERLALWVDVWEGLP